MSPATIRGDSQTGNAGNHAESRYEKPAQAVTTGNERVYGLDALRFVEALWVVFSHLGPAPIFATVDRAQPIGFFMHGVWGILHSGPAALIMFFVISGFCIHFSYSGGQRFGFFPT